MSQTGAIYKVTNNELKKQIAEKFSNISDLKEEADLSYFAIDFLEILATYSALDKNLIGKILQGNNSFVPDDSFIGFSNSAEVQINKIDILDKISIENFDNYLERAEKDNKSQKRDKEYLQKYFQNIKRAYEIATMESNALIFRIG
ncbi:hypothetical protein [Flavobacterium sp. HJJ]|uniref:hypothetical protein n=1 Tax=Flavobacterium sp. HJJ TaxID=2783792 RepID=UPI00188BA05B|nr:hypothetical protein [Flavobacterium sp. HJJ]MBF4473789.1 hypothetical protein [Flavobacterium sp. HJJ]